MLGPSATPELTWAKELLRETDLRHYKICYLVGFPSEVTGARTFKRNAGQTMTGYRRANRDLDV
jgi:transcriptional regulator GlxA family with amidase domain